MSLSIIILAAGKGKRMKSKTPKIFHNVGNYPMLFHVLDTSRDLKPQNITLVISKNLNDYVDQISKKYNRVNYALQKNQLGTADAVLSALQTKESQKPELTIILYADTPLISKNTLHKCLKNFRSKKYDLSVLSMIPENSNHSYGRLITSGDKLKKIIEKSELKADEKSIKLCNSGIMIAKTKYLHKKLMKIKNKNNKKEFFLTDIVEIMNNENLKVSHIQVNQNETLGVNDKRDLAEVENRFQENFRNFTLKNGTTIIDPQTVYFSADTKIDSDVVIHPNVFFGLGVSIGKNVEIKSYCHLEESKISDNVSIGPFARLRNGTIVNKDTKIGNFVEIKKSKIDKNVKISHLSYIGDAELGNDVNIGAGSITCNYDGFKKNKTFIGNGCFIGSNTSLIAPIKIRNNSIIGAGTVVDKNVNEGTVVYRKSELIKKNKKK